MIELICNLNRKECLMPLLNTEHHTIDYIYSLPEGERAELIDGVVYNMAPPTRIHQELVAQFTKVIGQHIDKKNGSCKIYPAPFAVFLENNDTTYVEPDISVICDKNKLDNRGCNGAPDWIIEIVSPSSRKMDYFTKLIKYRNAGVREYWIVDPAKERTVIYRYEEDDIPMILTFEQTITVGIYSNLKITISEFLK